MRWLLITNTENRNPGDEWIRMGVERLVREVDHEPAFIIRNKEFIEDQSAETEFDRAVWCGSPLFWSHQFQGCWENHWWKAWLDGWLFKEPRKVLVLGVGNVIGQMAQNQQLYEEAIALVKSKCWAMVSRNWIAPDVPVACCPAVFALAGRKPTGNRRLANLMPDGAHDAFLNQSECDHWHEIVRDVARELLDLGFDLVSHAKFEDDFAQELKWPLDRIHFKPKTAEDYLPLYQSSNVYVGNRMHGAVLARGIGASALAFGYDSRLEMVKRVGGQIKRPSQWRTGLIEEWMNAPHPDYDWHFDYDRLVKLMERFVSTTDGCHL